MSAVFSFTISEARQIFQKTFQYNQSSSHSGIAMIRDTTGDLFLISYVVGVGAGGMDILVKRTDSIGNIKWAKIYGTSGTNTPFNAIMTSTGEIIIVCQSVKVAGMWNRDILLFKIDINGNIIWWKSFGNTSGDLYGIDINEITEGNFIVTGGTSYGDSTT
ncbi:MAG: hypothetical protein ACR2GN_03895, partial [Bacteroidia bacterium]